ncbi:NAD(P)H-dependent oxidoreductase [Mycoplasmopsis felifaucium]|uniref:NAD(P)H-dependent oxidoreductase n=1 Tax=Mycoplasmopsis felifaucium TaxID=35768 RepID=UPI00068C23F1|nr:NAD(P)H-dependent oxidoreductase [Mycoplasmopsis felifaucium]
MKKFLIISGSTKNDSLNEYIGKKIQSELNLKGFETKLININNLVFDPVLEQNNKNIDSIINQAQQDIMWADEIVINYPLWWGYMPAKLKGFFDKTLLPGFAYIEDYKNNKTIKLLENKNLSIISTSGESTEGIYKSINDSDFQIIKGALCDFTGMKLKYACRMGLVYKTNKEQKDVELNNFISKITQ